MKKQKNTGFTIVELLIVIVVIGILAALVLNSFSGVQTKAKASQAMTDLKAVNKAILAYYAENSSYPDTSLVWNGLNRSANYVPGLAPTYINELPMSKVDTTETINGTTYVSTYMYKSNGTDYKLLAHTDRLCSEVQKMAPTMIDQGRQCWAYGYWSAGGKNF